MGEGYALIAGENDYIFVAIRIPPTCQKKKISEHLKNNFFLILGLL